MTNKLLSVNEMAEYLGVSERSVYDLCRAQEIPHIRVGRAIRFDKEEVIKALTIPSVPAIELRLDKSFKRAQPSRVEHKPYEKYSMGSKNPFKNYDDYGNLIAEEG
tara:strand:+ start:1708 stop:2025 length:318 start_codon:yes stop_codon:yes gene_type:complete